MRHNICTPTLIASIKDIPLAKVICNYFFNIYFRQISCGDDYNLALTETGEVYSW